MKRDTLFLLAPGFEANDRREFCPECAEIWGVLHYFPAIKEALDICYEPFAHPRPGLVAMLGDGDWNCPTLILGAKGSFDAAKTAGGVHYLDSTRAIANYFSHRYGTPFPRGG